MNNTMDLNQAHNVVLDLHKRAFFGRLKQHGIEPETAKEAAALLDLGFDIFTQQPQEKTAEHQVDYGDGLFAQAKKAYDNVTQSEEIAPGFPAVKKASASLNMAPPQLPPALVDQAFNAAYELAHDPTVYQAAVIKRASNEAAWLAATGENNQ